MIFLYWICKNPPSLFSLNCINMTSTDILNNSNRNMQNYSGVTKTLDMNARSQNTSNNINNEVSVQNEVKTNAVSQSKDQVLLNTQGNSDNQVVTSYSKKSIAMDRIRNLSNAEARVNDVTQENTSNAEETRKANTTNTNTTRPTDASNDKSSNTEESKVTQDSKDSSKSKESELKNKQNELTDAEKKVVDQMKKRDNEVRIHENQHKSVGGQYAGSPSYTYERGPDGKQYITEGEVSISLSNESTAEKTIEKMRIVQNAALAPAEPSSADRKVAAEASRIEQIARQEINNRKLEENKERLEENSESREEPKVETAKEKTRSKETEVVSNHTSNNQIANDSNKVANDMSKAGITVKNTNVVNEIKQPTKESSSITKTKDDFVINTNNKYTATYLSYTNELNKIDNRSSFFIAA